MAMRQINEYAWFDESKKELQLDIPRLLRKLGLPDTPEARDQAAEVALEICRETFPDATQDVHTMDFGTKRVYNPTKKVG